MTNPQNLSPDEIQEALSFNADDFASGLISGREFLSWLELIFGKFKAADIFNAQMQSGGHQYARFKPKSYVSVPHLGDRGFGRIVDLYCGERGGAIVQIGTVRLPFSLHELKPENEPSSKHGN